METQNKKYLHNPLKNQWWEWPRSTKQDTMSLKTITKEDIGLNIFQKCQRESILEISEINRKKREK